MPFNVTERRQEREQAAKANEKARANLKHAYEGAKDGPVLTDILAFCSDNYERNLRAAVNEKENPHLSASLLQTANAFAIVKAYITDLCE